MGAVIEVQEYIDWLFGLAERIEAFPALKKAYFEKLISQIAVSENTAIDEVELQELKSREEEYKKYTWSYEESFSEAIKAEFVNRLKIKYYIPSYEDRELIETMAEISCNEDLKDFERWSHNKTAIYLKINELKSNSYLLADMYITLDAPGFGIYKGNEEQVYDKFQEITMKLWQDLGKSRLVDKLNVLLNEHSKSYLPDNEGYIKNTQNESNQVNEFQEFMGIDDKQYKTLWVDIEKIILENGKLPAKKYWKIAIICKLLKHHHIVDGNSVNVTNAIRKQLNLKPTVSGSRVKEVNEQDIKAFEQKFTNILKINKLIT